MIVGYFLMKDTLIKVHFMLGLEMDVTKVCGLSGLGFVVKYYGGIVSGRS